MPKFEIQGIVERIPGKNGEVSSVLARGGCVKEANNAAELKAAWERDMRRAFGSIGPDYNIEFHATVKEVPDYIFPAKVMEYCAPPSKFETYKRRSWLGRLLGFA